MIAHIKALTRIIEKQNSYSEQLTRNFNTLNRQISVLQFRIANLQGLKNDVD